jgi:hypothetical protein
VRDPDFRGVGTQAWRSRLQSDAPEHQAHLAGWVINGPFHPFWSYWVLGVVSLAEMPGVAPPNKVYPEAEYEIMIVSCDPEHPTPDPDEAGWVTLSPADLVYQFDGVTDEQAIEIAELMVRQIVAGEMSPDSDYRAEWKRRLDTTVEHYKEGKHG